jgi:class 3 adenylate cyclase/predicted ATPase
MNTRDRNQQRHPGRTSTARSVSEWLRSLGLERYADAFAENAVDWQILPNLNSDDLREIGVTAVGHRRRLLQAIAALKETEHLAPAPATSGAERRQLTVMFCDLVGSTALATRLDPEDLRDLMGSYHAVVAEEVRQFDGFVAKYMGDGVLAYFGYPQAHEDDAERAIHAALALIDRVCGLGGATELQTRIGIATGLVVVGDLLASDEGQERGVVGETPNLAARLQGIATPNSVIICEATRRLLGDLFEYRDLGPVELKGFGAAVPVWQVQRPRTIESRFEALHAGRMTPLIGREEQLGLLQRRWARARSGDGQVVVLSGEPGIGKSRMSTAILEDLRDEPHIRLRYFCSQQHRDSALYPWISRLERAAGFERDDTTTAKLDKLETLLAQSGEVSAERAGPLSDLLGLTSEGRYPPLPQDPQRRRDMTLAALLREFERLARQRPVLLIFEDAQWADSSSLELLDAAIERAAHLPVLAIVTFRPEFSPSWTGLAQVTSVSLRRLTQREAAALVEGIVGDDRLSPTVVDRVVERADGIPLFIEELTKSLIEDGLLGEQLDGTAPADLSQRLTIPSSLQKPLMARLDRLNEAKRVAQLAAIIGREFPYELLRAVSPFSEDQLRWALRQLANSELIFQRGDPPRARYVFKHALIQDAAYQSLLKSQRRVQHKRVAETLLQQFPETAETQPELIAHHYTEAGIAELAIAFWRRAGERAVTRAANVEAVSHLRRGLELLEVLPTRSSQVEEELRILLALGPVLTTIMTNLAPEIRHVYERAQQLARDVGRIPELFATVWGKQVVALTSCDVQSARGLTDELFSIARSQDDRRLLLEAHHAAQPLEWAFGDLKIAHEHADAGPRLYRREIHGVPALFCGGHDAAVCAHVHDALFLQILGYPDRALAQLVKGSSLARSLAHTPSLIHALWLGAETHFLRRDPVNAAALVGEWQSLGSDYSSSVGAGNAKMLHGWILGTLGERHSGLATLRDGVDQYRTTQPKLLAPYRLGRAVEAFLEAGEIEDGMALLAEAIRAMEAWGERWYEAELFRFKGLLLLASSTDAQDKAEACFQHATAIAHSQGARLFELRAAMALSRLDCDSRQRERRKEILGSVYSAFDEGFDTPDLKEASALLDALA